MKARLAFALVALSTLSAWADGPSVEEVLQAPPDDPCATPMQSEAAYKASVMSGDPEEFWQMALKLRAARCGDVSLPPEAWEVWREKGISDAELLATVFNGTRVPPADPSPVPLPVPGLLLLGAILGLAAVRKATVSF